MAGFYIGEQWATVSDHKTGAMRPLEISNETGAHGGSDQRLFRAFLAAVRGECDPMTTAAESLWSHRMAFAADRAAREGIVIDW